MADRVLVFPSGGWVDLHPVGFALTAVHDAGFRPVKARYPLHKLGAADAYARQLARDTAEEAGERPLALGFSAGGTIVANLAARNLVRRCVCVGSPADLTEWDINPSFFAGPDDPADAYTSHWDMVPATMRERRRSSPTRNFERFHRHPGLLGIYSTEDALVPVSQGQTMARASRGDLLTGDYGGHDEAGFTTALPDALDWLSG